MSPAETVPEDIESLLGRKELTHGAKIAFVAQLIRIVLRSLNRSPTAKKIPREFCEALAVVARCGKYPNVREIARRACAAGTPIGPPTRPLSKHEQRIAEQEKKITATVQEACTLHVPGKGLEWDATRILKRAIEKAIETACTEADKATAYAIEAYRLAVMAARTSDECRALLAAAKEDLYALLRFCKSKGPEKADSVGSGFFKPPKNEFYQRVERPHRTPGGP